MTTARRMTPRSTDRTSTAVSLPPSSPIKVQVPDICIVKFCNLKCNDINFKINFPDPFSPYLIPHKP